MKKYFAKYLPVEGGIKKGDYYFSSVTGVIHTANEDYEIISTVIESKDKKVKLFLCSRDIELKDIVYYNGKAWMVSNVEIQEPYLTVEEATAYGAYKIIGEISPDTFSYVKEGNEFDEDEVVVQIIDELGYQTDIIPITNILDLSESDKILIKGPCGHFH